MLILIISVFNNQIVEFLKLYQSAALSQFKSVPSTSWIKSPPRKEAGPVKGSQLSIHMTIPREPSCLSLSVFPLQALGRRLFGSAHLFKPGCKHYQG